MTTSFADEIVETSNTTGTGAYSLAGAKGSYRTFRQGFPNGNTKTYYGVRNADNSKWELNRNATLTYGSPDTLTRNVFRSTNADAAVSWIAGDLPLTVYVPSAAELLESMVTGWLATVRHALLRFGHWFKQDDPSAGLHSWKIFDGTNDIQVGIVDSVAHSLVLDPGLSAWRELGAASPSGASSVDFTGIPAEINHLMLVFALNPGTNNVTLFLQTYGADGVLDTGGTDYSSWNIQVRNNGTSVVSNAAGSSMGIAGGVQSGNLGVSGFIVSGNIQAALQTAFQYHVSCRDQAGTLALDIQGTGVRGEADRITGVRIAASSGTITGKVTLYGSS